MDIQIDIFISSHLLVGRVKALDEIPHCGAFSTPHSHTSWAQIFVSKEHNFLLICFILMVFEFLLPATVFDCAALAEECEMFLAELSTH